MKESQKLARIFKVLSVDARVKIIQLLKGRALCVGAISARLDITQGAVSQHLRVLRDADLVMAEKRGYYVHYRLNEKTLLKWKNAMERFLGAGSEQTNSCASATQREKGETSCVKERTSVRNRKS